MSIPFFSFLRSNVDATRAGMQRLSPAEFIARREADAVVLDVRSEAEYRMGHLEGARQIDLAAPDFLRRIEALDRSATYYLYCRSGNRSEQAARIMKRLGFSDAYNIGGLDALARAGAATAR